MLTAAAQPPFRGVLPSRGYAVLGRSERTQFGAVAKSARLEVTTVYSCSTKFICVERCRAACLAFQSSPWH